MHAWLAVLALVSGCSTMTLRIPRDDLQRDLAKRFPVEADKHVVVLRASDPWLEFPGRPEVLAVRLRLAAITPLDGAQLHGSTRVEGRLEYVAAEHAFYLREPRVTELFLHPPRGEGAVARLMSGTKAGVGLRIVERAARSAIVELLKRRPVYRLDASRSRKEAKAIRHLRSVRVEDQDLVLEVGL